MLRVRSGKGLSLRAETSERISGWNELGCRLCRSFLAAAERLRAS